MNNKVIALLVVAFVVLWGVFVVTPSVYDSPETVAHRALFDDVRAEQIQKLQIEQGSDKVLLELHDGVWTVPSRGHYHANPSKVRSTLLKVVGLDVTQEVTENPENFGQLGVGDDAAAQGKLVVSLMDKDDKVLGSLIVGDFRKKRSDANVLAPQGQYIRRAGDNTVYLIGEPITLSSKLVDWLDTNLANVLQSQVQSIMQQSVSNGETQAQFELVRAKNAPPPAEGAAPTPPKFELKDAAEGEAPNELRISQLATGLENLRFNDVFKKGDSSIEGLTFDMRTSYGLHNGVRYIVDTAQRGDQYFAAISVEFDEAAAAAAADAEKQDAASEGASQSSAPRMSTPEEAKKLAEQYAGWVYELPKYLGQKFRHTRADLMQKTPGES